MDLLNCIVCAAISVNGYTPMESAPAGGRVTLLQAQKFHLEVQESLPAAMELMIRGFSRKKWTKGAEPYDRSPKALGAWMALDSSDKLRPDGIPMLIITLVSEVKDADAQWEGFGVEIEVLNEPNEKAVELRNLLLKEFSPARDGK